MNNLKQRKALAAKVLGVGKNKIIFDISSLAEIKEAITKQDIRDMYNEGIIRIRDTVGRKSKPMRTTKRGVGKVKKKVRTPKRDYVFLVRKLRRHLREVRKQGKINNVQFVELRKKVKAKTFKDKGHLKEHIGEM